MTCFLSDSGNKRGDQ